MADGDPGNFSANTSEVSIGLTYFALTWPPLFLLIGIPGNIISFLIWYRRIASSPGSTCLILAVMCATDTYVLVHGCCRNWMRTFDASFNTGQNFSLDLRVVLHCQTPLYLFTLASDLSVWLIILLCVERFISVWFPIHMKEVCHRRKGSIALLVTLAFLALVNANLFVVVERREASMLQKSNKPKCLVAALVEKTSYYAVWNYVDFAVYSFIPLALIVCLNYCILFKLHQTKMRAQGGSAGAPRSQAGQASARIFKTVAVMCVCHFLFTMPIVIYFLSEEHCGAVDLVCDVVFEICLMLQMANHLTHFFIYSWTSSVFQADLMRAMDTCRTNCMAQGPGGATAPCTETSMSARLLRRKKKRHANTFITNHTDLPTCKDAGPDCCIEERPDGNGAMPQ